MEFLWQDSTAEKWSGPVSVQADVLTFFSLFSVFFWDKKQCEGGLSHWVCLQNFFVLQIIQIGTWCPVANSTFDFLLNRLTSPRKVKPHSSSMSTEFSHLRLLFFWASANVSYLWALTVDLSPGHQISPKVDLTTGHWIKTKPGTKQGFMWWHKNSSHQQCYKITCPEKAPEKEHLAHPCSELDANTAQETCWVARDQHWSSWSWSQTYWWLVPNSSDHQTGSQVSVFGFLFVLALWITETISLANCLFNVRHSKLRS